MPDDGERFDIFVNGQPVPATPGTSVAAALLNAGINTFRGSVNGQNRGPVCGMGICFECRATVNGVAHERTCQTQCEPGMRVETGGGRA